MSENKDVDAPVRSSFAVNDFFARDDSSTEYSVTYDPKVKDVFRSLYARLLPLGYTPYLSGDADGADLIITKVSEPPQRAGRTPVFLLLLSLVSIIATGWAVGLIYAQAAGGNVLLIGASFVLGVTAVLLARDLAQRFVARKNGKVSSVHYYLPNIPLFVSLPVLYFLPTFGSISFVKSPMIDRDSIFDYYFAGAVAAVVVALLVAFAGASNALAFAPGQPGTISTNPSLLQTLALSLGGNSLTAVAPAGYVSLFSPVEIAAWIGFLIAFFSLVPAALLDGGRMATLVLGERGSKITTMVAAFLLVAIDVPNYWVLFLLIFLLAAMQPSNATLNSISRVSTSRKLLFLVAMLLVLVCVPVPQTFLTLPL